MSIFRVEIDRTLCSGFGSCVDAAPDHFALDGAGLASSRVPETDQDGVIAAAASCPMGAIAVFDGSSGEQLA